MSDSIYDENGQFTSEYKVKVTTHPVIYHITKVIFETKKKNENINARDIYSTFFKELKNSSKLFYELQGEAFDQAELVQHGLHMINCTMYQFFPSVVQIRSLDETYLEINKNFWGYYFYLNGIDGAKQAAAEKQISVWEAAKFFANEYWKFGQSEFMETIALGYQYLLENEAKEGVKDKIRFDAIPELLERFNYSNKVILGYCYFLGLSAQSGKKGEEIEDIHARLARLPYVDINREYEELLGPLQDFSLHTIFDELVWRFNGKIEVREIQIPNSERTVSEYSFKNHGVLFTDDRTVNTLNDSEEIFTKAMERFGHQFEEKKYDATKTFKTGVCAANIRAQADAKATGLAGGFFDRYLPLIFSAANLISRENISWSGHLKIKIPLQQFLGGLNYDLGELIWAFQSSIFFKNQKPRDHIEHLEMFDFMAECKSKVLEFYHRYPAKCRELAIQKNHWSVFPHLQSEVDEREAILNSIGQSLGYHYPTENLASECILKALIIFGYFCSLCETIIFQDEGSVLQ